MSEEISLKRYFLIILRQKKRVFLWKEERHFLCDILWTLRVINAPTMSLTWTPSSPLWWSYHSPLTCPPQPVPCSPQHSQQPHYPPQPHFYSAPTAWSVCQSKFVREGSDVPGILQPPGPSGGRQLSGTRLWFR